MVKIYFEKIKLQCIQVQSLWRGDGDLMVYTRKGPLNACISFLLHFSAGVYKSRSNAFFSFLMRPEMRIYSL